MSEFRALPAFHLGLRRLACTAVAATGLAAACVAGAASAQTYDQPYGYAPPAPPPAYDQGYDNEGYGAGPPTTTADVIVHAPRRHQTDPATGAPIEWDSASRVVRYDDLDLSQDWGVRELRVRIVHAARDACDELDNRDIVVDSMTTPASAGPCATRCTKPLSVRAPTNGPTTVVSRCPHAGTNLSATPLLQ